MSGEPVLVDTNVIIGAHRAGCWRALRGGHRLETVETCVIETQTGWQNRRPEHQIDEAALRGDLKAIHAVTNAQRAAALARDVYLRRLDAGELDLWCHALARPDSWVLCGPDTTSLRLGVRLGLHARLVALEVLLETIGYRPKRPLELKFTAAWHRDQLSKMEIEEGARRP